MAVFILFPAAISVNGELFAPFLIFKFAFCSKSFEKSGLAAAFGLAFNAKNDVSGTLDLNVHAQGPVTKPALNGQIAARNIRMSGRELREPVRVDAIEVSISPDAVRSN